MPDKEPAPTVEEASQIEASLRTLRGVVEAADAAHQRGDEVALEAALDRGTVIIFEDLALSLRQRGRKIVRDPENPDQFIIVNHSVEGE